ncbi:prepilin-type N-terminal cleavage/methylation domain-containing protein [Candidatus Saccharibacteria bacterium]|nr:prepilin-type N-terminal cleavage/methylation domain-containing protein [Candidatus Saccharibacteria bacterium]
MPKNNINSKKGFTIIEVVLVLAIAGLIFLMVFVALPALQRSQRDTARRNDLARVDTSLVQYQTNNQGTNDGSNLPYNSSTYYGYTDFTSQAKSIEIPGVGNKQVGGPCGNRPTQNQTNPSSAMACIFLRDYMNSGTAGSDKKNEFQDPAGTYYGMEIGQGAYTYPGTDMDYVIHVRTGARCDGEAAVKDTARHFAIIYRLEGAGTYCIDDQ